jgi:hypothetical protein
LYLFLPAAKKGYRSYPLRGPNGFAIWPWEFCFAKLRDTFFRWAGFGFAEFALRANSWASFGGVWGKAPNSENQNAQRFGSLAPSAAFLLH